MFLLRMFVHPIKLFGKLTVMDVVTPVVVVVTLVALLMHGQH